MASGRNDFLDSIKVDAETQAKLAAVSKNYSNSKRSLSSKHSVDEGGREKGDEGPGRLGREPGLKRASTDQLSNCFSAISSYKGKTKDGSISHSAIHSNVISSSEKTAHGVSVKAGHTSSGHGETSTGGIAGAQSGGHGGSGGGHGR